MNNPRLSARLGLAISALSLSLLSACGGGGGGDESASAPLAPAAGAIAPGESTASNGTSAQGAAPTVGQNLCGVYSATSIGDFSFSTPSNATMVINDYVTPIALLTSLTGYPFNIGTPTGLSLPMPDLRDVAALGYQASTTDSMGVELSSPFAAGTVACVAGISRVLPGTDNQGNPVDLVSLSSSTITNLPAEVQVQVGQPTLKVINGFEYMHNLSGHSATAVFRASTTALADPSAARICHIASSITCRAAESLGAEAGHWVLRAPVTLAGVYVLVADLETLAQD